MLVESDMYPKYIWGSKKSRTFNETKTPKRIKLRIRQKSFTAKALLNIIVILLEG